MKPTSRKIWQWVVGLFFVAAGANHFITPGTYVSIMPSYLPAPLLLVQISGVAEILGGLGVLLPATRRFSAWGLIALLVAVFPANVNMIVHGGQFGEIPAWVLWVRLPFQFLIIWWIYRLYLGKQTES